MDDEEWRQIEPALRKRWHLQPQQMKLLRLMMSQVTTAKELTAPLQVSLNTVRTYMKRLFVVMGVRSKAEAVAKAWKAVYNGGLGVVPRPGGVVPLKPWVGDEPSEADAEDIPDLARGYHTGHGYPPAVDDQIDVIRRDLATGLFRIAEPPLQELQLAASGGHLDSRRIAEVYLLGSTLRENRGSLRLAERYADLAFAAATESNQLSLAVASRIQKARCISRSYEDARALEIVQAVNAELIRDPVTRVQRDVCECVFSCWAGVEPPARTLHVVADQIGSDPRRWPTELAFLTQGLEVGFLDTDPFPPWVLGRTRVRLREGRGVLDDLIALRREVFPAPSAYATLLDLLNRLKEAMAAQAPKGRLVRLFHQAIGLASVVGADRLARVFQWHMGRLPDAVPEGVV